MKLLNSPVKMCSVNMPTTYGGSLHMATKLLLMTAYICVATGIAYSLSSLVCSFAAPLLVSTISRISFDSCSFSGDASHTSPQFLPL